MSPIEPSPPPLRHAPSIPRTSLIESILDDMESRIASGEWRVGTRLPGESSLTTSFQVSRPIIREALARLRERGLITTLNGRGSYVQAPSLKAVEDAMRRHINSFSGAAYSVDQLYEAREIVEVSGARAAAIRRTSQDVVHLQELVDAMAESAEAPDSFAQADLAFHIAIANASANPLIPMMLSPMIGLLVRGVVESSHMEEAMRAGLPGHVHILAAIEAQNPDEAEVAMREHLVTSRQYFPPGAIH